MYNNGTSRRTTQRRAAIIMKIEVAREKGRTIVALEGAIKLRESGYDFFKRIKELSKEDTNEIVVIDIISIQRVSANWSAIFTA